MSALVLRDASGQPVGFETDPASIYKVLKVIGNYKQLQAKAEGHVKLEPDSEDEEAEPSVKIEVETKDAENGSVALETAAKHNSFAAPCHGASNCYLPGTAFRSPSGPLLSVEQLEIGSRVMASDGSELTVAAQIHHDLDKHSIVELVTRKGSFKVSACHRISVADLNGAPTKTRLAAELGRGDSIFMGTRQLPLTKVTHFETRTKLVSITFFPDVPVEAFMVPCGLHTRGEAPWFSQYSEADLRAAMPMQYED